MSAGADAVFGALADPTRRRLLVTVARTGPRSATDLAGELPISRQAVAKHLAVLGDAGLVTPERAGRETRYSANPEPLDAVRHWIDDVGGQWDRRLEALGARLVRPPERGRRGSG